MIGSQPIRIQLGKILWENLAGKYCRKFLQEILAGKSCGKILWEILEGKSCRKFRRKSYGKICLKSCGTGWRGKGQFKKGSGWWKFSIWNRVMGSQQIRIQLEKILWENLAGNSSMKILQENLAEQGGGEKPI